MTKKIYIASDHAGFELKKEIIKLSNNLIDDLGTDNDNSVDYPDFADKLVNHLNRNEKAKGILICGSGAGMVMAANRYQNIRAGLAFTPEIATLIRKHNDANVLVLPGRFIDIHDALKCVDNFLTTKFEFGRHEKRVNKLNKKLI